MSDYRIRRCTIADAATVARHRVAMFLEMGEVPSDELASKLLAESTSALAVALGDGSYVGWFALDGGDQVIAGAGTHIKPQLPRIAHDGTRVATWPVPLVVNVYTDPPWRHRGIAKALMETLIEWARAGGYDRVVLHATEAGRPLYTSLGFKPTNEMRWSPGAGDS
jgi:GNAT superfamily N-acetyltransferase